MVSEPPGNWAMPKSVIFTAAVGQHHDVRGSLTSRCTIPLAWAKASASAMAAAISMARSHERPAPDQVSRSERPSRNSIAIQARSPLATDVVDGDDVRVVEACLPISPRGRNAIELLGFLSTAYPAQATVLIATMRSISGSCAR